MADKRSRRRGKGALYKYQTKAGERWRWQLYVPIDAEDPDAGERRIGGAGFPSMGAADDALSEAVKKRRNQEVFSAAGCQSIKAFAEQWISGLDRDELAPSTIQGYDKIVRNHITPALGTVAVDKLTATRIARHYRELRESGRKDAKHVGEPLSANSVNKVHIVLGALLDAAIDDGLISQNPAKKSRTVKAPTGKHIRAQRPEIHTWTASELHTFLTWNKDVFDDDLFTLWRTIAYTGMRRSEVLALRWGDLNVKNAVLSIRRAVDVTARNRTKATKTEKPRAVDLDTETVAALKSYKALRGSVSLDLARPDAYIFGNLAGQIRSPNEVTRRWVFRVETAQKELGEEKLKRITLKELRHTHATLLLELGEHPKIVQERLGHSDITTTMNIYSHVTPTMQRTAIDRLTAHIESS